LTGAIVGVLGIVACFSFRDGINDAQANPQRSGIVWDYQLVNSAGAFPTADVAGATRDPGVGEAIEARWVRNILIDGKATPTFGTKALAGDIEFVMLSGRAPRGPDELAAAPATMHDLGLGIGDLVRVGPSPGRRVRVVGEALLPSTSHTEYDQSAWMTRAGLDASLPPVAERGSDDLWDYVLVRWKPDADVAAAQKRLAKYVAGCPCGAGEQPLPAVVSDLGRLRSLPFALGIFFALLAIATVAHALVTTVRRWRHDLAVMRAIGFTRGQARIAIAWQSTLLAAAGVVVGVPLGIVGGRMVWRWLADSFPVVYVAPVAVIAIVAVVPVALIVANALAAGPARTAARIRPAEVLRAE
jgi:predicted lysophospholipase L1 biosynthesis ABC-type transport system permease subunit